MQLGLEVKDNLYSMKLHGYKYSLARDEIFLLTQINASQNVDLENLNRISMSFGVVNTI